MPGGVCGLPLGPPSGYVCMVDDLCAVVPNVRICEIDIDDVPWKDDLVTEPLEFDQGRAAIPDRPGWGADLNEEVAREHVWARGRPQGYCSGSPRA